VKVLTAERYEEWSEGARNVGMGFLRERRKANVRGALQMS
jgi:hypothetical protein